MYHRYLRVPTSSTGLSSKTVLTYSSEFPWFYLMPSYISSLYCTIQVNILNMSVCRQQINTWLFAYKVLNRFLLLFSCIINISIRKRWRYRVRLSCAYCYFGLHYYSSSFFLYRFGLHTTYVLQFL